MLQQFILLFVYLSVATAKTITGVFNSFDSLTWSNAANYAFKGPGYPTWNAVLGWSLDGTTADPGDTFTLIMPCVFKFITTQTSVDLTANGVKYATCSFYSGEEFTTFSSLTCTVNSALTSSVKAFGTVTLPISFNVGGTGSSVDLEDSKCFTAGTNTVTFTDGDNKVSTTVDFEKSTVDSTGYLTSSRLMPSLNKVTSLFVAPQCARGYTSGTIGFSSSNGGVSFDCSNVHVGITNGVNDWNFPVSSESFSYTKTCSSTGITITYRNVPAGYRPFIDAYITASDVNSYTLSYTNDYTCVGGSVQHKPFTLRWSGYKNGEAGSNGIVIVATTRTVTDSTTAVTTLPFNSDVDKTKTIEILQPIPTTTITTSYVGVTTSYSTKTAPIGETATVIVDVPYHTTTTVTSEWTGTITTTTTQTNPTDSIDTVVVQVPSPNPTVSTTEYWSQSFATTTTVTAPPGGTDTVIIREPPNHTVTTTEYWSQSYATTTTVTAPPGGTDTVIIREPPNHTVTTTEYWSQSYATTATVTAPPGGTDTVIIREPPNHTVTTTEYWSQSYATTTTVTAPPGGTDTVIIREPPNHTVTTTEYWSQSFATTTTVTAPPGGTDTVIIYESMSSSKISISSDEISSIIPSFSRPHYVNSTTIESSSVNIPTSTDNDNVLLSSTTLFIESRTTTEMICSDDKGCSESSSSSGIVTNPDDSESSMVINTVHSTTTVSDLHSSTGGISATSSENSSESGVSISTDSSITTTHTSPNPLSTSMTSLTQMSTNPSVLVSESKVTFTSDGDNQSGSHGSQSTYLKSSMGVNSGSTTSTEIEIVTTSSTSILPPVAPSSTVLTTESTNTIEQPTRSPTISNTINESISTSQPIGGNGNNTSLTSSVPTVTTDASATANGEDNRTGSHGSSSTHLKSSMGENSESTTYTEIEVTTSSPTESSSPIAPSSTDATTESTNTIEQPSISLIVSSTIDESNTTSQPTPENGGNTSSTNSGPALTTGTSASMTINSEVVTSASNDQSHSNFATNDNIIVSNTPQTTLSQQAISSSPSTNTLIVSTYDGSGSIIQHSAWLYGLITVLSLFI